jgi:hypothetical protein
MYLIHTVHKTYCSQTEGMEISAVQDVVIVVVCTEVGEYWVDW